MKETNGVFGSLDSSRVSSKFSGKNIRNWVLTESLHVKHYFMSSNSNESVSMNLQANWSIRRSVFIFLYEFLFFGKFLFVKTMIETND